MDEMTRDDWDPGDESVLQNQRSAYDKMREKCPVAHSDFMGWSEQQWEFLSDWANDNQHAAFNRDQTAGKALATLFSERVKPNLDKHRASLEFENNATDALLKTEVDSG